MIDSTYLSITGTNGAGKTTISANLGLAFTRLGYDTLLVDGNDFPTLGLHFNIPFPSKKITSKNNSNIKEIFYYHPSGLKLLLRNPLEKTKEIDFSILNKKAQIIIIDGKKFKKNIAILNNNMPSIIQGAKEIIDKETIGIIINKINSVTITDKSSEIITKKKILSSIEKNKNQKNALKKGIPLLELYPDSDLSKSILKLAAYLIGKEYKFQ
jgi:septum site-determining protein MinD